MEAVERFKSRFGDRVMVRAIGRSDGMKQEYHKSRVQTVEDAVNCLVDALIMSRCQHLIHSVSNIATAALYIHPEMSHTYLRLGRKHEFGGAEPNPHRVSIRKMVRVSEADNLCYFFAQDWSDWVLLYPNQVLKRAGSTAAAKYRTEVDGSMAVKWSDGLEEHFVPTQLKHIKNRPESLFYRLDAQRRIIVYLKGGLGSQLFTYAFGMALAKAVGGELHAVHEGLDGVFGLAPFGVSRMGNPPRRKSEIVWHERYEEGVQEEIFAELRECPDDPVWLEGDFQDERFFLSVSADIREKFYKPQAIPGLRNCGPRVAVHMSLEEGLEGPSGEPINVDNYLGAMDRMREEFDRPVFVVFSDRPELCRRMFGGRADVEVLLELSEMDSFSKLQSCEGAIVGDSAVGWWAAWLSGVDRVVFAETSLISNCSI
ncbi:alpha-1,2-fucosyltransferase [Haloferula chungangensis]|uniref:Alpha-1,2-fucosyltransferase n=1 Tax=Haloferula chungangensis TaxID=1048331 RepID=A0ABW2LCP5_9BACT